jgi:glutathione synthase/RimK-type ligase-like ATP-grasp enzyme
MNTVALVTSRELPHLSADDRLLLEPLAALGVHAVPAVWDDPEVQWQDFDAVIVRSIWDYHKRILEFDEWLARLTQVGARVCNPTAMLRWNSDKRYLLDLRQRGVPLVPTAILSRDRVVDLGYVLQSNGWGRAVVKPTVSASAYRTWLTEPATAQRDQKELVAMMMHSDVIVQPFLSEIVKDGEYSFVFFEGEYSHCVHKQPRRGDYRTQPEHGGRWRSYAAPKLHVAQARAMLSTLPLSPMYARVDCIVSGDRLLLMELELIEPDLGLTYDDGAALRFANVIARMLRPALADGETFRLDAPA